MVPTKYWLPVDCTSWLFCGCSPSLKDESEVQIPEKKKLERIGSNEAIQETELKAVVDEQSVATTVPCVVVSEEHVKDETDTEEPLFSSPPSRVESTSLTVPSSETPTNFRSSLPPLPHKTSQINWNVSTGDKGTDREEVLGPLPAVTQCATAVGIYLKYARDGGGKLFILWRGNENEKPIEVRTGEETLLAYTKNNIKLRTYKTNIGVETLATSLETNLLSKYTSDRRTYYVAWLEYLKQCRSAHGSLVLLQSAGLQPPPKVKIITCTGFTLSVVETGTFVDLRKIDSMAVVPKNSPIDHTMSIDLFTSLAMAQGAYASFPV